SFIRAPCVAGEAPEALHKRLRHDLRTPLNAIKGYSELLIEDMEDGEHPLRGDLVKLKDCADQLLAQVDTMFTLTRGQQAAQEHAGNAQQIGMLEGVLRNVRPVDADIANRAAAESSRILVVDDNAANRDVLARRLTRQGHRVATAANGAAALELVGREEFDLVLLDLIMPEMD